jgi:CheY-like chemotaxis protein
MANVMTTQVRARCPRCQTTFSAEVGADGFIPCPGCGARLKHKRPPAPAQPKPLPPDATHPSTPRPSTPRPTGAPLVPATAPHPDPPADLEQLVRTIHQTQLRILEILEARLPVPSRSPEPEQDPRGAGDVSALPPPPLRARRRKNVLLVDDDPASRQLAANALEEAQIPVQRADTGQEALVAVATEKPDVLVLEGELEGEVTGRDLVDRIKATMEWVDIPIVLYTRVPLQSLDEARTAYSADAYVLKGPNGGQALVSQVIAVFRAR